MGRLPVNAGGAGKEVPAAFLGNGIGDRAGDRRGKSRGSRDGLVFRGETPVELMPLETYKRLAPSVDDREGDAAALDLGDSEECRRLDGEAVRRLRYFRQDLA